jgi:ubiquinone/menaquinone biosynthesis C-methylase UbiE
VTVRNADIALPLRPSPAFDAVAAEYDRIFTHSILGKAQRSLVHEALRGYFRAGQHILDLNCGTGEDAVHLASQDISIFACDISERMIGVARSKAAVCDTGALVEFAVCANENLKALHKHAPFDGALSNFGGLNCTTDLAAVARSLAGVIRPEGNVFLCMLSRFCAWEILWYAARAQWDKAFRRLKAGGTEARIEGARLRVYYPSVDQIAQAFAPSFKLVSWRGIGVTLPPTWLEPVFQNHVLLVDQLVRIDRQLGAFPFFRGIADHILLRFVREGK